jgi:hypothetical protein
MLVHGHPLTVGFSCDRILRDYSGLADAEEGCENVINRRLVLGHWQSNPEAKMPDYFVA